MQAKRNLRQFYWFVVGVLMSAIIISTNARAETIPASSNPLAATKKFSTYNTGPTLATWAEALAAFRAYYYNCTKWSNDITPTEATNIQHNSYQSVTCNNNGSGSWSGNIWHHYTCPTGGLIGNVPYTCAGNTYYCPAGQNWTLNGTSCTRPDCVAPQVRQSNGTCSAERSCYSLVITATGSCLKPSTCVSGQIPTQFEGQAICQDTKDKDPECKGIVLGYTASGKPLCLTEKPIDPACQAAGGTIVGTLNGQNVCSKSNNPTCPSGGTSIGSINGVAVCDAGGGCSSGHAPGTVNGVTSCYPIGKVTEKTTTQKAGETGTTTTTTPPTGPATTTGEVKTTTCTGDRCTTTTRTTGGDGQVTTQTTTEDKGEYCAKNPNNVLCKGNGTGSDTGDEPSDFCTNNPTSPMCKEVEAGTAAETGELYSESSDTVGGVMDAFRSQVASSPIYTAATQYFSGSIPTGSCSGLEVTVPVFTSSYHYDAGTVLCGSVATSIYSILGIGVMLAAGWVAFRIAIL